MKMQILSWLCLIMCAQAIAFIACHSSKGGMVNNKYFCGMWQFYFDYVSKCNVSFSELSTDMNLKPSARDDQEHTSTRGVEAVVHDRRGAYGGSDLMKKPAKTRNGASNLPAKTLGRVTFCVCMVVNCFFLLVWVSFWLKFYHLQAVYVLLDLIFLGNK